MAENTILDVEMITNDSVGKMDLYRLNAMKKDLCSRRATVMWIEACKGIMKNNERNPDAMQNVAPAWITM